jgi:hypothetical protein
LLAGRVARQPGAGPRLVRSLFYTCHPRCMHALQNDL